MRVGPFFMSSPVAATALLMMKTKLEVSHNKKQNLTARPRKSQAKGGGEPQRLGISAKPCCIHASCNQQAPHVLVQCGREEAAIT
jgi:hypothetical protein